MLTSTQLSIINKYVDDSIIYKEKLIQYLELHDMVGEEIFDYTNRKVENGTRYDPYHPINFWYQPVSRDTFIRRVPFYFYNEENYDRYGNIGSVFKDKLYEDINGKLNLEAIYQDYEYMLYDKGIEPVDIFNYVEAQFGENDPEEDAYWLHYLHLTDQLGWSDTMPERLITAYNKALEASGLEPKIYAPIWDDYSEHPYSRTGKILNFEGSFPCDENGHPIMKWIGLKIDGNYTIQSCSCEKSKSGNLLIEVTPSTVIYMKIRTENDELWYLIYAGPLTMEFDNSTLKLYRNKLGYTQQEVADAIGANLRTYQKWEYGNTQPDGVYLVRLMNWLDIPDVHEVIKVINLNDPKESVSKV